MEQENKGLGASADADRAAGLRPQPPAASSRSSIPSAWLSALVQMSAARPTTLANSRLRRELEDAGLIRSEPYNRGFVSFLTAVGAQAIEAASAAETANAGSVHESAVGEADAPEGDLP